jgi:hypothetical protein
MTSESVNGSEEGSSDRWTVVQQVDHRKGLENVGIRCKERIVECSEHSRVATGHRDRCRYDSHYRCTACADTVLEYSPIL